ncbi:MAG: glycosyltransferase [Lentisphaeria bacterium]|nr:glycosyltransferase [Lentisphaeria bacterium]
MNQAAVAKYFRKNPPPALDAGTFSCAVVIPAYDEAANLPAALDALEQAAAAARIAPAVIVVVNHPPGTADTASLELLKLLADRRVFTIYLPELAGGVGAARKAGMDAFCAAVPPEKLEQTAIFSLDADTLVAPEYFLHVLPEVLRGGGVALDFAHRPADNAARQQAIDRYEAYLRRYRDKLRDAGSPYAFFTIGSAFAVRGDAYIRAGGMKVREAGEDFYFLQAVAKTSGVRSLDGAVVFPSPRTSHRVPFGTGPAVAALLAGKPLDEIPDRAFEMLKQVLAQADGDDKLADPAEFLGRVPEMAAEFFRQEHFETVWKKVLQNLPHRQGAAVRAFHEWFDGLKTLRFLHQIREISVDF